MARNTMIGGFQALAALLVMAGSASAQAGVPGGRLESARDHRAAVRADTYTTVNAFMARWREAWNSRDTTALERLYLDDASARFPGQRMVRGREPFAEVMREALRSGTTISMSDIDFESDGETAVLVSYYFVRRDGENLAGLVTAVLLRVRSGWRLRMHVFEDALQSIGAPPG